VLSGLRASLPRGRACDSSPDGSNRELLCRYCHDNEHVRQQLADAPVEVTPGGEQEPLYTQGHNSAVSLCDTVGVSAWRVGHVNSPPVSMLGLGHLVAVSWILFHVRDNFIRHRITEGTS
jgi:hypothetical protein